MKPAVKLGLVYWASACLTFNRPSVQGAYASDQMLDRLNEKAKALAKKHGAEFDAPKPVTFGTGFKEHGLWHLYRFTSYTLEPATFAAYDFARYAARFKGMQAVDSEHLDYQGNPKLWSD